MCDLMTQDDMMYIGLFGEEYKKSIKTDSLNSFEEAEIVELLQSSAFSGILFTNDKEAITEGV